MKLRLAHNEDDNPCTDELIVSKCLLLGIGIYENSVAVTDLEVGLWYVGRYDADDRFIYWCYTYRPADVAGFKTAQKAFAAYVQQDPRYTWG